MRTRLPLALVVALVAGLSAQSRAATPLGVVTPPQQPGSGRSTVLLLLPDTGGTAADVAGVVRAAQLAADRLRLWVAVPTASVAPADAEAVYAALLEEVRTQGFAKVSDGDVVVAGWGRGALAARQLATTHALAGTAALGSAVSPVDLRVLGELDRSVPVVTTTAASTDPVLSLPAARRDELRGPRAGAVLGDLVEHLRRASTDLRARLAADRLVDAVRRAASDQGGSVCAELQHHTADLATADRTRISVTNRVSSEIMSPTPEGVAAGDFGGFLYDKAELADDGVTARLTTNSYVVPGAGPAATEVMCKTKSRSAVAQALYDDFAHVDGSAPTCGGFTQALLARAGRALSPAARARSGGVSVLPDQATSAGPQWVFTPMTVAPADPVAGRWQVQSPSLVTELSDTELDPEFAGNHYCKVLSPLRALELLLQDAVPATA